MLCKVAHLITKWSKCLSATVTLEEVAHSSYKRSNLWQNSIIMKYCSAAETPWPTVPYSPWCKKTDLSGKSLELGTIKCKLYKLKSSNNLKLLVWFTWLLFWGKWFPQFFSIMKKRLRNCSCMKQPVGNVCDWPTRDKYDDWIADSV